MSKPNDQLEKWWTIRIGMDQPVAQNRDNGQREYFLKVLLGWNGSVDCFAALEVLVSHALRPKDPLFELAQEWVKGKLPQHEAQIVGAALDVLASVDKSAFEAVASNIGELIRPLSKEEIELAEYNPATINFCKRLLPPPNKPDLFDACIQSRIHLMQPNLQRQISLMAEIATDPAAAKMPELRQKILQRLNLIQWRHQVDEKLVHEAFEQNFEVFAADLCSHLCVQWKHAIPRIVTLAELVARNLPKLEENVRHQLLQLIAKKTSPPVFMVMPELIGIARPDVACQLIMHWVGYLGWLEWDLEHHKSSLTERGILREVEIEFPVAKELATQSLPGILAGLSDADLAYLVSLAGSSGHHGRSEQVYGWFVPAVVERIKANKGYFRENFVTMFPKDPPDTAPEVVVPIVNELWEEKLRSWAKKWLQRVHLPTWSAECTSVIDRVLAEFVIPHALPARDMLAGRVKKLFEQGYVLQPEDVESGTNGGVFNEWLPRHGATSAPMPEIWQNDAWRKTLLTTTEKGLDMSIEWLFATARHIGKGEEIQVSVTWLDELLGPWQKQREEQRAAIVKLAVNSCLCLGMLARAYLKSYEGEMNAGEHKRLDDYFQSHLLFTLLGEPEFVNHMDAEGLRRVFFERKFDKIFTNSSGRSLGDPAKLEFLFPDEGLREGRLCPWLRLHAQEIRPLDWLRWVNHFGFASHVGIRQKVSQILRDAKETEVSDLAIAILSPYL